MSMKTIKLILIGDSGVGKSSIVYRFIHNTIIPLSTQATVGASFFRSTITVNNTPIALNIWDTAGQERFNSLIPMYVRGAHGCLCVFDLTSKSSIVNLKKWITLYRLHADNPNTIVIIGNKSDLPQVITDDDLNDISITYGVNIIKTSAINGSNINDAVHSLSEIILASNIDDVYDNIITL